METAVEPDKINAIPSELLHERALEALAADAAQLKALQPLARAVTNLLLERMVRVVWQLSAEQLQTWSKQRALAKVVASATGGRIPSWADAERPGNCMYEWTTRYRIRIQKYVRAEKARSARAGKQGQTVDAAENASARTELEQGIYHCSYGCTPACCPVRRCPPGKRPREVEYVVSTLADENKHLQKMNCDLKKLETEAVELLHQKLHSQKLELQSSVAAEYMALVSNESERQKVEKVEQDAHELSMRMREEQTAKKGFQKTLREKAGETTKLGAQLARLHMDFAQERRKMEQKMHKLALQHEKEKAADALRLAEAEESNRKLKEKLHATEEELRTYEGKCLTLGAHITRVNCELFQQQRAHMKAQLSFEQQKRSLEADLVREQEKVARLRDLKNEMARKKRAAEGKADTSERRLERAQTAEARVRELEDVQEELLEVANAHQQQGLYQQPAGCSPASLMPVGENGRFGSYSWQYRVLIYKWLLRCTPPSAIGANIVDAVQFFAPTQQELRVPSKNTIRRMRQEATLLGEGISAFRIASCKRVVSFGFDETTKMGDGLASINFQIETADGKICDEVLRAAFLIPGGCADQVARAMESKLFVRGRKLLEKWKQLYEDKNGEVWPGPKLSQLGYHRLTHSLLMSDTCNGARASKRLIAQMAGEGMEKVARTAGTWDTLTELQKEDLQRCYIGDCMQHIRNILIDAMVASAASMLKDELQESLDAFSAYERMSTEPMQLIRAAYKEFHHEGEYAKGKGKEFEHWRRIRHPSAFFMPFERAAGARQDLAFDGALPLFANRVLACTFLREQVFSPGHSNVLEDFLWCTLSSMEMIALTRVLTLWNLVLSRPLRWLCGSASKLTDWSVYDFGPVLDCVERFLQSVADDGEVLLDEAASPFAEVASRQPLFKDWQEKLQEERVRAPDGKTTFRWYACVLTEARRPQNKSNDEASDMTIQLAMTMAKAGLQKMRDPKVSIHDWLTSTDGKYSRHKVSEQERQATVGAHSTNDRVESNFGCYDSVIRRFRTISVDAASGIAQQMRVHHLDARASYVISDRRKSKSASTNEEEAIASEDDGQGTSTGFFGGQLSAELQETCVEMARLLRTEARRWERSDRKEQDEYKELRRAQKLSLQLDALAEKGAIIVERFEAFSARAVESWVEAERAVSELSASAAKVSYLREQIELRVLGFGWSDLCIPWKKAEESTEECISRLSEHLRSSVLPMEADRRRQGLIPTEPPLPDFKAKSFKQLGTATTDSLELAERALCSPEQLQAAVQRERERRLAAGFSDDVQARQPKEPPDLGTLGGRMLEVCWNYISTEDGKTKVPIWCPCTVIKIADGSTDLGRDGQLFSTRAKKLAPRGMLLVEWDADPERGEPEKTQSWLMLDPMKWQGRRTERDPDTHRGWRYHPEELRKLLCQRRQHDR